MQTPTTCTRNPKASARSGSLEPVERRATSPMAGRITEPDTRYANYGKRDTDPCVDDHGRAVQQDSAFLPLQSKSSPISQDELAVEVKAIYASLVKIEAKCITIDTAQGANIHKSSDPEQWQALIALRRTLLYEHHDFLMATQHPSSALVSGGLAAKYSMPARMWKHGIHAFLEVLRHRHCSGTLPLSQEYILAFIYLAYQMMALLYETVPAFTDTWIECLGDLARYRMAIEEERDIDSIWGSVAAGWYSSAVDRHPVIGRLNHHLGILERPRLTQLSLYPKSLTRDRFPNEQDSLATLCAPIVRDECIHNVSYSAEALLVMCHAMPATFDCVDELEARLFNNWDVSTTRLRGIGTELIVSNIAAIIGLSSGIADLWLSFIPSWPSTNDEVSSYHSHCSEDVFLASPREIPPSFFFERTMRREPSLSCHTALPLVHTALFRLDSLERLWSKAILAFTTVPSACQTLASLLTPHSHSGKCSAKLKLGLKFSLLAAYAQFTPLLPCALAENPNSESLAQSLSTTTETPSWYSDDPVEHALSYAWRLCSPLLVVIPVGFGVVRVFKAVRCPQRNLEQPIYIRNLGLTAASVIGLLQQLYDEFDHTKLTIGLFWAWFFIEHFLKCFRMVPPERQNRFVTGVTVGTIITDPILASWISPQASGGRFESSTKQTVKLAFDLAPFIIICWTWGLYEAWKSERQNLRPLHRPVFQNESLLPR